MGTMAENVFHFILQDPTVHQAVLQEIPPEKRVAVTGRKGRLIVTGPEGGRFIVRLTPVGIFEEEGDTDIRNEILMTDSTLMEILIWISKDASDPGIDPRAAYANRLIQISGDSVLYDAEEIFTALEKHAFARMKPIAKSALEEMRKKHDL